MATPRETGKPKTWMLTAEPSADDHQARAATSTCDAGLAPGAASASAAGSLSLSELVAHQRGDRRCGLRLVAALGLELDLGALAGRQHHHAHDALGIHTTTSSAPVHLAGKAAGQLGELGRRARMQPQLVIDREYGLDHGHRISRSGSAAGSAPVA